MLVVSTLTLAYCKQLAAFLVDLFGGGQGDWDPERANYISDTAIGLAVVSFYLLDFALNALQASLRNLLLDITPADQLNVGNAWHSRMTQAGNIVGYGFGFFPLEDIPVLKWIGGSQFRKFCILVLVVLVTTVWITCWTQEEQERPKKNTGKKCVVVNPLAGRLLMSAGTARFWVTFMLRSSSCLCLSRRSALFKCLHSWDGNAPFSITL